MTKSSPAMEAMSVFASTITTNKYAHELIDTSSNGCGKRHETWPDIAERQARCIIQPYQPHLTQRIQRLIEQRKFLPGGRYLYAAGRKYPQVNSCFLFDVEDNREDWARLSGDCLNSLMTGGGVGVVYSKLRGEEAHIAGLGGKSSGPLAFMKIVNEQGRYTMQGGSRRSAIWSGLHWNHPDCLKYISMKDWSDAIHQCKREDFNFPAPMDGTNISVILDDEFFLAYNDSTHYRHGLAHDIYWTAVAHMLRTGEPGFSVDCGENQGENCRNAPVHGDTLILTKDGYQRAADLTDRTATVWTGQQWAEGVQFHCTSMMTPTVRVTLTGGRTIVCDPTHPFMVESYEGKGVRRRLASTSRVAAIDLEEGDIISVSLPTPTVGQCDNEVYTLGFIYGDGSFTGRNCAEVTICHESKTTCIQRFGCLSNTRTTDSRGYQRIYFHSDPSMFSGRDKRFVPTGTPSPTWAASFLAGLFDADGNVDPVQKRVRLASSERTFIDGVSRMLETLGILSHITAGSPSGYGGRDCWQLVVAAEYTQRFLDVIPTLRLKLDLTGYTPYRKSTVKVTSVVADKPADVYCCDVGVEEHSFVAEGVVISNCTEVTSRTNRDMCNLGSVNMARMESIEEFAEVVELGTLFLLCGSLYSKLPVQDMYKVREQNRRLGLGLMGVHEWMLKRGQRYEASSELKKWMEVYAMSSAYAQRWADKMSISRSIATRALAPNGTIAIVAETTTCLEPMTAVAYKRRYLDGKVWKCQYVVDPAAVRLIQNGVDPDLIEDSYTLAEDMERRVEFQAWMQQYVDHGIASTINLPEWGSSINNEDTVQSFGNKLMKYLPRLRGITAYPNGARGGQPITRCSYQEAIKYIGKEYTENGEGALTLESLSDEMNLSCKDGFCSS